MAAANETATPATKSWLRWLLFPLVVLVVLFGSIMAPSLYGALGFDPDPAVPFFMLAYLVVPIAILLLAVWFFFFSGLFWQTKLLIAFFVALFVAGAGTFSYFFVIRKFEFTTGPAGLVPRFQFTWETSPSERVAAQLEKDRANPDELPKADATVGPEDFARYRGPHSDGIVPAALLQTDWQKYPPQVSWKRPCDGGYSGIAVAGNLVVTLEQRDKQEAVVCYDRATGRQRWIHAYDAYHKDVMGDGPRSTPTIHNGRIFTVGATGQLVCVNADGKHQWDINILEDSKAKNIQWGLTGSPLIVGDLVVAHAGIDPKNPAGVALVAFDQATGAKRWAIGNRRAGYSSPQLATLGGVQQIILFDGEGLVAYDPASQKELWQFPWVTAYDMNSIQPIVVGKDQLFISSEAENGCALVRVKAPTDGKAAWSAELVWKNKNLGSRFANPVTDGKRIFAMHGINGILTCLDANDGSVLWKGDRYGPGQMLLVGNTLLVVGANERVRAGMVSLIDPAAEEPNELARFQLLDSRIKTWNTPALAGDQLFVRNQAEIACMKLPRR